MTRVQGSPVGGQAWGSTVWPQGPSGWLALAAAAVGLGSWVALPLTTTLLADAFPVTDTFIMPLLGLILTALAAILNAVVLWWGGQRSALNIVATALTIILTGLLGLFIIGEVLTGA